MMQVLDHGFVELVTKTGHPGMVVDAARCSYGSSGDDMGERDRKLVRYLLGNGHTSPFRHHFFTFHVKAPLFVFRQWWKYQVGSTWREYELEDGHPVEFRPIQEGRIVASDIQIDTDQGCSWNELSGRYKVMEPEFYHPVEWRANTGKQAANAQVDPVDAAYEDRVYQSWCTNAMERYNNALKAGIAKELARLYLPPSIYSECYWTVSLQAVLHFLDQRLKEDAQYEIRQYASAVLELIKPDLEEMGIEL